MTININDFWSLVLAFVVAIVILRFARGLTNLVFSTLERTVFRTFTKVWNRKGGADEVITKVIIGNQIDKSRTIGFVDRSEN